MWMDSFLYGPDSAIRDDSKTSKSKVQHNGSGSLLLLLGRRIDCNPYTDSLVVILTSTLLIVHINIITTDVKGRQR